MYLRETVESCLAQDYRPLEILVIDGGSTDNTVEVLQSFGASELSWTSNPDNGVVDAVNIGFRRAAGEILSIQSSDDVFLPGAMSAAVRALQERPELGLVYGDVELIDEHSNLVGEDRLPQFDFCDYLGRLQYIPQPGTFFTRRAMEKTGLWREQVSYAADADFWMRMLTRFPAAKLDRKVARYRYHPAQRDCNKGQIAKDWERAVLDLIASDALEARHQRFARMGIELAKYRYASEDQWLYRTRKLYRAAMINPGAVLNPNFPKRELFPARTPIWRILSRIKRGLGFRARSSS